MKARAFFRGLLTGLAALLFSLCCAAAVLFFSDSTYALMPSYADASYFGVDAEMYPRAAKALSAYMRGENETPQITVTAFGAQQLLYNEKELSHLFDVRQLARIIAACAVVFGIVYILLSLKRTKRTPLKAYMCGEAAALLLPAVLAWAASTQFYRFFYTLHSLLFTNDNWLLNPYEDVLITLMPEGYFIRLAIRMALMAVGLYALLRALPPLIRRLKGN